MSLTVCLAPANTIAYPNGGGHFWVYLHWALGLKTLGCRVLWLEMVDPSLAADETTRDLGVVRERLRSWGLEDDLVVVSPDGRFRERDAAAEADLLINLWHGLPEAVVRQFRRSVLVDTDPGLLQIWMTTGDVHVAPHDVYFTIGETVGTRAARFPDCGVRWHYTPPPIFLPEWPTQPGNGRTAYTTVAHWWGGTFEFQGMTFCNEKRVAFLQYADLPMRTPARLELAVCLAEYYEEYRRLLEPKGWTLREAWDVSSTPEQYRAYVQQSRGEFSCAKPAYVTLETAWVSDRTLCYLASGKPAVVQHTGRSRILPDNEGLIRFRTMDEAVCALAHVVRHRHRPRRAAELLIEDSAGVATARQRVIEFHRQERADGSRSDVAGRDNDFWRDRPLHVQVVVQGVSRVRRERHRERVDEPHAAGQQREHVRKRRPLNADLLEVRLVP